MSTVRVYEFARGWVEYQALDFTGPHAEISLIGARTGHGSSLPTTPDSRARPVTPRYVSTHEPAPEPVDTKPCSNACGRMVPCNVRGKVCSRCRYARERAREQSRQAERRRAAMVAA